MDLSHVGIWFAFLAGVASFFSPCVFALVPAYIGYLGGRSVASARGGEQANPWVAFSHGVAFVLGFSFIFIALGVATSMLGELLYNSRSWLTTIGGVVVIIFGVHMTGIIRIPFLEYDLRPQSAPDRKRGYVASFLMGIFFSAGWSPCVGPILGAILTLSLSGGSVTQGIALLTAYSAGLAIPFLIASLQIGLVTHVIRKYGKLMHYVEVGMGILLIIVGILLLSGRYESIARYSASLFSVYNEVALGRMVLILVVVLGIAGLLPAYLAYRKGRQFVPWWIFGATLFPVALPMAWLLEPYAPSESETGAEAGSTD